MENLKTQLENKIKAMEMEIIRSINDFERETGLAVDNSEIYLGRDQKTHVVNRVSLSFDRYPEVDD